MTTTIKWAKKHGIDTREILPAEGGDDAFELRSAQQIAHRTIILHAVTAVGYGVESKPIVDWLADQSIWSVASSNEQQLLLAETHSEEVSSAAQWRQEAEWALLWSISKVESLGLPTKTCDTARLVDEIMPELGESIEPFTKSAQRRSKEELFPEDDRIYNLHCYARQAIKNKTLPSDFIYPVIYQRHYAMEWLTGTSDWDDVRTDT